MPNEKTVHTTARDFFSHLLGISMLYVGVISFLALLFQYINVRFPDPLNFYYLGSLDIIRNSMAALIVVWPVYLLMTWLIRKDMKAHPEKAEIWVRKWLMYLTLFVAAITIIIDLVTLINNFLGGELTITFGLKVLSVLAVAVAVFWYYLWDLREGGALKSAVPKRAAIISSVVGVLVIVVGFFVVGSPAHQRQVRFDDQRVNDLSMIQNEVTNYWAQKRELPTQIDQLSNDLSYFQVPVDPETGASYEYAPLSDLSFEICATFTTESIDSGDIGKSMYYDYRGPGFETFKHSIGRTCFERTIDPELYPETVKIVP